MRSSILFAVALVPIAAFAADIPKLPTTGPEWAFPDQDVGPKPPADAAPTPAPAAARQAQDPAAPAIVRMGKDGGVRACDGCHFVNGMGEPQTSHLAGLPSAYFVQTMADFRSGARQGLRANNMVTMSKLLSDEENKIIGDYYAALKPVSWVKVIESAMAPKTYVANNNQRRVWPTGGEEPIGERVIEFAVDAPTLRAAGSQGHVAYVPPGSIAEGETLVKTGGGKSIACGTCHGADWNGAGTIPGITGGSPVYAARQIYMYRNGDRSGPAAEIMKSVVANLQDRDIVAITAYLASRPPH